MVAAVAAAGVVLVGGYAALGGGRYSPIRPADPCAQREWRDPEGARAIVEQVALSALDGAACALGVSRERLALALADDGELAAFTRAQGIDDARLQEVLRSGLQRAIRDGLSAGAISPITALIIGEAIQRIPYDRIIAAYRSGDLDWIGALLG